MDIEKNSNREAFECWFRTTATYKTLWDFISTHQTNIKYVFVKRNGKTYQNDCVQIAWEAWQAAKAQAVPEGFVLVSQKELLELVIAINAVDLATHTEGKPNEVREMWQDIALKLMALGEAQEPTND